MKKALLFFAVLTLTSTVFVNSGTAGQKAEISKLITQVVPKNVEIDNHPDAKKELIFHLESCGAGVVEGIKAVNRCKYTIKIDDVFLQPVLKKTGLKHDNNWPYQDGIIWATASAQEMAEVPNQWDLSDDSKMIRITKQRCGDCWAQSTRANLEQLILTHTGVNEPLSTQTMISRCCNTGSCNGGYMTTPGWVVENGLPILERDPYLGGKNSSCKFNMTKVKWDYHLMQAPYVGSSRDYSRAIRVIDRKGAKVANTQALMIKHRSSTVATIKAISSSGGIITSCSSINSGGNHMQNIVGWYMDNGELIARVQNSWGTNHGQNGYTHIKWECGDGRLNRGLGRSSRVGVYNTPTSCKNLADPYVGHKNTLYFEHGTRGVQLGRAVKYKQTCSWLPKDGLNNPNSCNPIANPKISTEYHLTAETDCGKASAMVLVRPLEEAKKLGPYRLNTPSGEISWAGI